MSVLPSDFILLQVVPRLDTGGAEQTTLDIAAAVQAGGGRALVASMGGRMEGGLKPSGAVLETMPVHSKNPLVMMGNAVRLARLIRRAKVSLVHVRSRAPAFSALWAARVAGVPLVATYHGVYNAKSPLKRWYNGVMTRGRVIIANSEFTRGHVIAQHGVDPAKVIAIPRGVDIGRFDPAAVSPQRVEDLARAWAVDPADRRVKILLAGRLTRWKGQTLAIAAAGRLKTQGVEDFLLILAGDSQGRAGYLMELETAIRAQHLEAHVRIVGHCADMPAAYALCDVAIAPSLDPEAFGRTAVEPQAMGRPVIAADHGATRETVAPGETGWLAEAGDVSAWTEALAQAIQAGPEGRAAMGRAAMERARRLYSVDAMCAATLKVYADVLAGRL
ncbi:MAG: glycosyl transferase [Caulobacteraceae bacterium]|nr:glycosyl transferase [Caulobacteraceae bacterium]